MTVQLKPAPYASHCERGRDVEPTAIVIGKFRDGRDVLSRFEG